MIRSVDLSKAVKAGAAGALAMEVVSFALRLAGIHAVDLAAELGSVLIPLDHGVGWAGGLAAHLAVVPRREQPRMRAARSARS